MTTIPNENPLSAIAGLFGEGFTFISNRRKKYNSDIFKIGIPGLPVICIGGEDAARIFYDPEKFQRKGAVPPPIQKTLTGVNAIHTTDGSVFRSRKEMFLSLMTDENIARLGDLVESELKSAATRWEARRKVTLFTEAAEVLYRAICKWSGVPLNEEDGPKRTKDFLAMVDAFGSLGSRNIRGRKARKRTERWIRKIIKSIREGKSKAQPGSALALTTFHREPDGLLLSPRLAAIELINILRPTVAIAWYVTFAATALITYPSCESAVRDNTDNYRERFINEVRRFYPFAPFMGAKVKQSFSWNDYTFPAGALVLLDMYGTNHDGRLWSRPATFDPDRFIGREIKPFDFLAQGGGDPHSGHRCPGEWITIEALKRFLKFLTSGIAYTVPRQDLSFSLSRMPTLPKSGFVMDHVKKLSPETKFLNLD
ncbi:cytochrome P450 [Arcticibacter sp. MXS-1]|uniref:cytochrome P450 n=1 Tax=Arcticibacter sp. MXS-1 TaxID=3341726 RepID=UPI0035A84D7D